MEKEKVMPEAPAKRSWEEIVKNSNGNMIFVPERFEKDFDEIEKKRKNLNEKIREMAELEITFNMFTQNVLFEIRREMAANDPSVWTKDLGMNMDALREGKYVLNCTGTK